VHDPQREPQRGVDPDLEQQRRDRGGGGEGGEGADVADRADHPGADHAADHEAQRVGGGDQAGRELARLGQPEAHRQERCQRAIGELEDRRREDHRRERHEMASQHRIRAW
jgi:hypothetical protein